MSASGSEPGRAALIECRLLDPRPGAEAAQQPIADAVNIPLPELPRRVHELPPRHEIIRIAGPAELAAAAARWCHAAGRAAEIVSEYQWLAPGAPAVRGRLWRPNAFLAEVAAQLSPGLAVDLGCGTGRDAVYLAAGGWQVTGIDILPDALERAAELARRYLPPGAALRWIRRDLRKATAASSTAGFIGPKRGWSAAGDNPPPDLITALRFVDRDVFRRIPAALRPGGSAVCEAFTTVHRRRHGQPARDAHVVQPGELREIFSDLDVRHYSEGWRGELHTARLWGVRKVPC